MKNYTAKELSQIFNINIRAVYKAIKEGRTNCIGRQKQGVFVYYFKEYPKIKSYNRLSDEIKECVKSNIQDKTQQETANICGCSQYYVFMVKHGKV